MVSAGRTFGTKTDASQHLATIETDLLRGEWRDPALGRTTFGDFSAEWMSGNVHLKPTTRADYDSVLRTHLLPRFEHTAVAAIRATDVRKVVSEMQADCAGASTIAKTRKVLGMVLGLAVRADAIKANPTVGITVPRARRDEMVFLDLAQVHALADAIARPPRPRSHPQREHAQYALLIRFAALTGLRAGEIAGLRRRRLDLAGRRVLVEESATEPHGMLVYGPPKSYERRAVPIPDSLVAELAAHVLARPPDPNGFVFTAPDGGALRHSHFYRRHFKPAVRHAGLPERTRFHDLRHTYAALLIEQGAPALAIMKRLGHSTITVTMNTYGHLFPALEEALTDRLDAAYRAASESRSGTLVARGE
jgi:integrase